MRGNILCVTKAPISLLAQLQAASAAANDEAQSPAWPMNPFPPGPRPGSTTTRVLAELRQCYPNTLTHSLLVARLGSTRGAVCWALHYLVEAGKAEAIPRADRPPYQRYRAVMAESPSDE